MLAAVLGHQPEVERGETSLRAASRPANQHCAVCTSRKRQGVRKIFKTRSVERGERQKAGQTARAERRKGGYWRKRRAGQERYTTSTSLRAITLRATSSKRRKRTSSSSGKAARGNSGVVRDEFVVEYPRTGNAHDHGHDQYHSNFGYGGSSADHNTNHKDIGTMYLGSSFIMS